MHAELFDISAPTAGCKNSLESLPGGGLTFQILQRAPAPVAAACYCPDFCVSPFLRRFTALSVCHKDMSHSSLSL